MIRSFFSTPPLCPRDIVSLTPHVSTPLFFWNSLFFEIPLELWGSKIIWFCSPWLIKINAFAFKFDDFVQYRIKDEYLQFGVIFWWFEFPKLFWLWKKRCEEYLIKKWCFFLLKWFCWWATWVFSPCQKCA